MLPAGTSNALACSKLRRNDVAEDDRVSRNYRDHETKGAVLGGVADPAMFGDRRSGLNARPAARARERPHDHGTLLGHETPTADPKQRQRPGRPRVRIPSSARATPVDRKHCTRLRGFTVRSLGPTTSYLEILVAALIFD
jgi:hypothetical protein